MPNRIFSPLSVLSALDLAQLSDPPDLGVRLDESLLRNLTVDQVALGCRVGHSSRLLGPPCLPHAQIGPVQVILANLMIIVQSGVLVMLSRLERGHFDSVGAPLALGARQIVAAAIVTVVLLFDPCS